jgi:hypothetical protein
VRKPNFGDLRYAVERRERVDIAVLANAMAWFCGERATPLDTDAVCLMAFIIKKYGPQQRLIQARKSQSILARNVDLFHTTEREVSESLAEDNELKVNRVLDIRRGRGANTSLIEYIESAQQGRQPTAAQFFSAKEAIAKIRNRLFAKGGKGDELRAQLVTGWGLVGKTSINEEAFYDVEALRNQGVEPGDAIKLVAQAYGQKSSKVKTDHQRMKAAKTKDLDAVVAAINEKAVVYDENDSVICILPLVTRDDLAPKDTSIG